MRRYALRGHPYQTLILLQEVKMNREEAKELAKDAISWAELLTTTLNELKIDGEKLADLEGQLKDIRGYLWTIAQN
jgi:hypothetical protein